MNRRQLLAALGLGMGGLPLVSSLRGLARAAAEPAPKRLITFYVSSGCAKAYFWPDAPGAQFDLKTSLEPLAPYQSRMTVIQGLGLNGGSDHRFGMDNCLTAGAKTSYELALADALGRKVLAAAVAPEWGGDEMSVRDGVKQPGLADPAQLRDEILRQVNPAQSGGGTSSNADAVRKFRSLALDLSQKQLDDLKARTSSLPYEAAKVQKHIEAVQALKANLSGAPVMTTPGFSCQALQTKALDAAKGLEATGIPARKNLPQLLDAQIENVVEAMKCGTTTLANIQVMHAWGNTAFEWLGITESHHQQLSHWIPSEPTGTTAQKFAKCHNWLSSKMLTLLQGLDVADPLDPGKTILDNTVILWTSEVNGSDAHLADNIPVVLFGNLGGALKQGQYVQLAGGNGGRNMGDLFATLSTAMGAPIDKYGPHDSKGLVTEIVA